ncbi:hypothetical protein [Saccharibacillus sp. JS10]|uniref:hypothetical protein n=1 Tax=Saccharibacillus sp. JS10 TaxID=2950552 RepID=UPI00210D5ECA|nr:hypothetical protein [Saccharibacillus sp. JS10]MCQ4087478.1 hypothetical protein [Saccharibacillus sp. JS10]
MYFFIGLFIVIFVLVYIFVQKENKKENDEISEGTGIIVTTILLLLAYIPLILLFIICGLFLGFSSSLQFVQFSSWSNLPLYIFLVLLSMYVIESFIIPITMGVLLHYLRIKPNPRVPIKETVSVLLLAPIFYIWATIVPGIHIQSFLGAIGIAVLYQLITSMSISFKKRSQED